MVRFGFGYDAHRLVPDRPLILGGVEVEFSKGLLGHSDADVLTHAVCDALLGAAALGDIGQHFPDTDPQYAGISSLELLRHVRSLLDQYTITNIDSVIMAERPKLAPCIPHMRRNIAETLLIEVAQVSVKATTLEGLGEVGRGQAMIAQAVVGLIERRGTE